MASFPQFSRLPVELQLAIWELAVADPQPEVCIAWPMNIDAEASIPPEEPALPFTVDTAWPAVPYRRFIPAIDTLYCGRPAPCRGS